MKRAGIVRDAGAKRGAPIFTSAIFVASTTPEQSAGARRVQLEEAVFRGHGTTLCAQYGPRLREGRVGFGELQSSVGTAPRSALPATAQRSSGPREHESPGGPGSAPRPRPCTSLWLDALRAARSFTPSRAARRRRHDSSSSASSARARARRERRGRGSGSDGSDGEAARRGPQEGDTRRSRARRHGPRRGTRLGPADLGSAAVRGGAEQRDVPCIGNAYVRVEVAGYESRPLVCLALRSVSRVDPQDRGCARAGGC